MARTLAGLFCFTVALGWCVATANAYTVSVVGPYVVSEGLQHSFDVILDTEGETLYGYVMNVYFDPGVLTPVGGAHHPIPGEAYGSLYRYPDNWYVMSGAWSAVGPVNQSIATMVFQVMNLPGSWYTDIVPVITTLTGPGGADFSGVTTVVPMSIHIGSVPEPSTALLVGLGLVGMAVRRMRAT